jgi:hypothetical protein
MSGSLSGNHGNDGMAPPMSQDGAAAAQNA